MKIFLALKLSQPQLNLNLTQLSWVGHDYDFAQVFYQCFTSVFLVFHQCLTSVSPVFNYYFTSVSSVFHKCFTYFSPVSYQCLTSVLPLSHQCLTTVSPLFHHCFTSVVPVFHKCLTTVWLLAMWLEPEWESDETIEDILGTETMSNGDTTRDSWRILHNSEQGRHDICLAGINFTFLRHTTVSVRLTWTNTPYSG